MQPIVKLSFFQHRSEIIDYDHVFNQCILLYFLTFNCGISYKRCINFLYKSSKFMKEVSKKNNSILSEFGASFDIDENKTVAFYLASTVFGPKSQFWAKFGRLRAENPSFYGSK